MGLSFGFPAVVAVSLSKKVFAVQTSAFEPATIGKFLNGILSGKQKTGPFRGGEVPKIVETTPWDGKDAEMPEEEPLDMDD